MRVEWAAITASTAVDERASNECLRHQGYASAIQNVSNPACSQALAMATVSGTGSMLSCRTPILNGTGMMGVSGFWFLEPFFLEPVLRTWFSVLRLLVWIFP